MADWIDEAFRKMDAERASASLIVDKPAPEAAARANALARQTGVPPETADRNLSLLQAQVEAARARQLFTNHPELATWAANPRNAAVGADDMDGLAKTATAMKRLGKSGGEIKATPTPDATFWGGGWLTGIGKSFALGVENVGPMIRGVVGDYLPAIAPPAAPGTPRLGRDYGNENDRRTRARLAARVDDATPQYKSKLARDLYGGGSSLAFMAPSIAAGFITGSGTAGAAVGGAQVGVSAYNKYRDRGGTRADAVTGALGEGTTEFALGKTSMGFLVGNLGKLGAGKLLAGFFGREIPTELATTVAQNAVDTAIANPEKTWTEYAAELPDDLVSTAVGTLVAGGAFGGLSETSRRLKPRQSERSRAYDTADALNNAMEAAAESKTRLRDGEAFGQYVALHTRDSAVENIYVAASGPRCYFQPSDRIVI